jgi:ribonuclease Z
MEIVFLGTSCMVPTKDRNHQAIFISHKEEGLLIDCGEGTQRQFKIADIKQTKISKILITHWHGDHVLGLPGLLQTLNSSEYEGKLCIYGPIGTKKNFENMLVAFSFTLGFEYDINEIKGSSLIDLKEIEIEAKELDHSVPCLGYSIIEKDRKRIKVAFVKKKGIPEGPLLGELQNNKSIKWKNETITPEEATYTVKGKKITLILDTVLCTNAYKLAKDADLLICEAVYSDELINKAEEYKHMTALQAAELASQSNAKKLILTHFSQRYKTTEQIIEEAKTIFSDSAAAYDFMKLKI